MNLFLVEKLLYLRLRPVLIAVGSHNEVSRNNAGIESIIIK
ncbi:uncharacterized protein METZ01_LOCUS507286 [marine metagenome]|uniref:Uncharacterized protein n=1 Tax=marine metagenome TaxID=408172 RepID=A0A383EC31_9ZZZZ